MKPMPLPIPVGVLVLAAIVVLPALLWGATLPLGQRFSDFSTALTSIGTILGLVGMTAFSMNLVLGARLRPVQALLGGLENMYRIHRTNGRIAYLLVAAHALAIVGGRASSSWADAAALFDLRFGWETLLGLAALAGMTASILLTLYGRLGQEAFVYVQRSFGIVFIAGAVHAFRMPGAKALSPILTYYLLAVACAGIAAWTYRSLFGNLLVRRQSFEVARVNRLDDYVTEITMAPKDGPLPFTPGQFVFVSFRSRSLDAMRRPLALSAEGKTGVVSIRPGDIANQFHPFSITSGAHEPDLRITVKAVGDYTGAMRRLEPGAEAIVEGPYGTFSHENVGGRLQVWLAGGIGVTPFLSMARSLDENNEAEIDFYYCVDEAGEAHFLMELEGIARRVPGLRLLLHVAGREGLITADRIEELSAGLQGREFLICGPPPMIHALRAQLTSKGIDDRNIHAEEFGFARIG